MVHCSWLRQIANYRYQANIAINDVLALRAFDNTITRDIAGNRVHDESIFIEKKREGEGKVEKSSCKLGYDTRNRRENIFSEGELVVDWT